jgi:serine/threonine-protein kinase RsbW
MRRLMSARLPESGNHFPSIVRMRMPSRRSAIAPTVDRILEAVLPAGFSRGQRDDLAVALSEALANAAVHGNALRPGSQVSVKVAVQPRRGATITVRDSGSGFDSETLPDPSDPQYLMVPRGRGVFLMRQLLDDLSYNRRGNEARLTLLRHGRRRASS